MSFRYDEVVPWGRSYDEYRRMFALSPADRKLRILGCGDGPASFNCEMTRKGHHVVSIDPLYSLSRKEIKARIEETFEDVITQTRREQERFVWTTIPTVDALGELRMKAMQEFLGDYDEGRYQGRYVAGGLPSLPDLGSFGLALCSHLLFLYSDHLSFDFHLDSIVEMLRAAEEVRVFPLLDMNARRSPHVERLVARLSERGNCVEIVEVPYEFQRGGNQMLRVMRAVPGMR